MKKQQEDRKTKETYESLGRAYLDSIKNVDIEGFFEFIKTLPEGGRVLDVGCAGGRDSKRFAQNGFEVVGIDLADEFLKEAKKNVPEAKFLKMDLRELDFPENYFDAIWAVAVLLHIRKESILETLNGFRKILKSKGKLFITVKRGRGSKYVREKLSGDKQRFFTYFFKYEMEDFVRKSGFRILNSQISSDILGRKDVQWIIVEAEKV